MNTLGKKIRLLRQQRGWSQQDVANRLKISIPAFSKIETGITDINLSRLEQISALFETSPINLLSFGEEEVDNSVLTELNELRKKLAEKESEIIDLQKKLISLYEQK